VPNPATNKYASTGLYVRAQPGLRLRDKKVERLARKMRQTMPWLQPSDWPACRAWAEMEFLAGQVYAALRGFGMLNTQGEVRRLFHDYRAMRATQAVLSNQLGMTPLSRAALKASNDSSAFDLAEHVTDRAVGISKARNASPVASHAAKGDIPDGDGESIDAAEEETADGQVLEDE
jgi:hypothetical protein